MRMWMCHIEAVTWEALSLAASWRHIYFKFISSALLSLWEIPCQTLVSRVRQCSVLSSSCINSSIMGLLETHPYQSLAALFFGCILFRQLIKSRSSNPNGLPLPPGPKGYPLIGSLFDMPINKPWLVYDEWCKTYGKSFIMDSLLSQGVISF